MSHTGEEGDPLVRIRTLEAEIASLREALVLSEKRNEEGQGTQQYWRLLAEHLPAGAVYVSGDSLTINRRMEGITGYSAHEIRTVDLWFAKLYGEKADMVRGYYESDRRLGFPEPRVVQFRSRDGETKTAEFAAYRIDVHEFWFVYDLTDFRKTEEQLRQSQKMELIGTLTGGVAHDFNNLLTPIVASSQLLRSRTELTDKQADYVESIEMASLAARDLVKKILLVSESTDGKSEPVDMEMLVKEVLRVLRSSIPSGANVELRIEPDLPRVMADRAHMYQVVLNVITNSVQAISREGTIEVALFQRADDERNFLHFRIQDDGCGMSPSMQERIFQPFFTTKKLGAVKGSGLGLAVVFGIVNQLQGTIDVESEEGKGTSMDISLPTTEAHETSFEEVEILYATNSQHIFLVDDETENLHLLEILLDDLGYQVSAYASPSEAFEAFRQKPGLCDLLITDLVMPEMSGYELSKELRDIRPDLPILLMTGVAGASGSDLAAPSSLILKPFPLADFSRKIYHLIPQEL